METLGASELSEARDWYGFMFSAPPSPSLFIFFFCLTVES
jgi:hypothetical protein